MLSKSDITFITTERVNDIFTIKEVIYIKFQYCKLWHQFNILHTSAGLKVALL